MRERKGSLSVQNSIQTRLSSVMALVMVFVVCINFFIFEQIHTGVDRIDAVFFQHFYFIIHIPVIQLIQKLPVILLIAIVIFQSLGSLYIQIFINRSFQIV